MLADIWQGLGDGALYRATAEFVRSDPKPGVEKVSEFLLEKAQPDMITLVIGQFLVASLFERRNADLVFWSLVAADINNAGMEQWPAHERDELAGHLKRISRNPPH
ncbi:hypothetical protein [Mesorhizobium sp. 43Arga]